MFARLIAIGLCVLPWVAQAEMYRWVNAHGQTQISDSLPPGQAQYGYEIIDSRGRVIEKVERALTRQEILQLEAQKRKEERQRLAEKERIEKELRYDQTLLRTFSTEADIVKARDSRIAIIDNNIKIAEIQVRETRKKLKVSKDQKMAILAQKKPVPEALEKELAIFESDIKNQMGYIFSMQKEKSALQEKFDNDLTRFRYLKQREREEKAAEAAGID